MKKILLTIALFVLPLITFAQARVNFTEQQIKQEFRNKNIKTDYTKDGIKYLYTGDENVYTFYYINNEGICYSCMMVPQTRGILNWLVEDYNGKYVIVSDTEWKYYSENGIMYITLTEVEDRPVFLYYTIDNKEKNQNNNRTNQY